MKEDSQNTFVLRSESYTSFEKQLMASQGFHGRVYGCNVCFKMFRAPSLLRRHEVLHTGIKSKKFNRKLHWRYIASETMIMGYSKPFNRKLRWSYMLMGYRKHFNRKLRWSYIALGNTYEGH